MKNALIISFFFTVQITAQTVDNLTESLTKGVVNDSQKVVRIYDWITKNINYEARSEQKRMEGDTILWQEPQTVIARKKAVCIGYAKLFQAMCRSAQIDAEVVPGISKNINGLLEREEHAWNVVKIRNNWFILDATWGAGYLPNAKSYFLMAPSVSIETHYPNDPMWQLLENPRPFSCFLNRKNCHLEENTVFNFRDTISVWFKLDSVHQIKNSAERSLRYHPNNIEAIRSLANAYSSEAFQTFQTFAEWRNRTIERKNAPENYEMVQNWIDIIESNLQQARFFYDRLITFARAGQFTDAQFNRDLMSENLLKIESERRFVMRFFKKQ